MAKKNEVVVTGTRANQPEPTQAVVPATQTILTADHFLTKPDDVQPAGPYQPVAGYVQFVSPSTKNEDTKDEFKASGGKLPGFLHTEAGSKRAVQPFNYHLFSARLLYTKTNNAGKVIGALDLAGREMDRDGAQWQDEKYRPHYYALIGVIVGSTIRPATINGRNGLHRCFKNAADRLTALKTQGGLEAWVSGGDKYKVGLATVGNRPMGLFIATGSGRCEAMSDDSGNSMNLGDCSIRPVTVEDGQRFMTAVSSDKWMLDYQLALSQFNSRVNRVLSGETTDADTAD